MSNAPFKYRTAKLPNDIEFAYTDSGAPSSSEYTTLVILHGAGFISKHRHPTDHPRNFYTILIQSVIDTFQKLHPLALKAGNVRIFEVNRRGYLPSTLYSPLADENGDGELSNLTGKDSKSKDKEVKVAQKGYTLFWQRRALEIADLLLTLIRENDLPKIKSTNTGGIVLMGWSMGTATTFAFLGQTEAPGITEKYGALQEYLKGLIMYGKLYLSPTSLFCFVS